MTAEMVAPASVTFDVDAMLMYGWVADASGRVTYLSNSLRRWIRERPEAERANALLTQLEAGNAATVGELLGSLLDPRTEEGTPELVEQYMQRLAALVADTGAADGPVKERRGPYRVLMQYHGAQREARPLAGARFVRDSATLMASSSNAERVDIVVVAIVERHGTWWRVRGFQGQLQEAWLRVSNRIKDGNRAGSIALMARNLSHNIGSHALYWVASGLPKEQRDFLSYLQVRMELLAGFATSMPLSPVVARIHEVVSRFRRTTLLLNNISRSESVNNVQVTMHGEDHDAVFFGGEIGMHAFYSILENCIRDSAKFAPPKAETLEIDITVQPKGQFLQVDVSDRAQSYERSSRRIREALDGLRISDERGALDPLHWGIKERFVCAALLRGQRPEDFPLEETGAGILPTLGTFRRDGARILSLENVDGNCSWRFYLPTRAADVLLVTDARPTATAPGTVVQTFGAFAQTVQSAAGITSPFVVLDGLPAGIDQHLLEAQLPHRTYVRGDASGSRFISVDAPLSGLTPTLLLQKTVERLQKDPVRLLLAIKDGETRGALQFGNVAGTAIRVIHGEDLESEIKRLREDRPAEKLVIYRRHPWTGYVPFLREASRSNESGVAHFETYDTDTQLTAAILDVGRDPILGALRLLEAALTKILIIDERIDLTLRSPESKKTAGRERLLLQGITVRGAEFAGHAAQKTPVSLDMLPAWVNGFHFVLLHRGVADKLCLGRSDSERAREEIVSRLESGGARVIMHSGRMGMADMPKQTKFISLANVTNWIDQSYSKLQILNELASLRRV